MKEYLYNHNYISNNKKPYDQQELSIERAECIINKHDNIVKQEKQQLISFLEDKIKDEYIGGCDILSQNSFKARKQAFQEVLDFVNKRW